MDRWVGGVAAAALFAVFVAAGCGGKKPGAELDADRLGAEWGEEALPGDSSLAQARAGTLGLNGGPQGPLQGIHFSYDSFDLDEAARQILQRNAEWLRSNPGTRVEVEGHCDERGTIEYNLALGAKRAASAKSYLVALGIAGDRVTTISYGEELPLCSEPTESCWSRNRRAHFVTVDY